MHSGACDSHTVSQHVPKPDPRCNENLQKAPMQKRCACTGGVEEPVTPSRSRSRSPDQDKVEHADILGHYNQLAHAGVNLSSVHVYW